MDGLVVEADGMQLKLASAMLGDTPRTSLTTTNLRDVDESVHLAPKINAGRYEDIEAARRSLYEQAMKLDAFADVSPRHLSLLCDAMCASGHLRATKFTGVGRLTASTLGKAVFQSPMPTFVHAAVTNRAEHFDNVSTCLITGERVPVGTGAKFTLIMDDGLTPEGVWSNPSAPRSWYSMA